MQRFKQISLIALLLGITSVAYAGNPPNDITMFPPVDGSCVKGEMNIISWDGKNQVRCMHVPKCGSMQILSYDGTTFSCYPTGNSGPLSGAPTAQFPTTMNVSNITPEPLPNTIPQLPAGVVSASATSTSTTKTAAASASGSGSSIATGLVVRGK